MAYQFNRNNGFNGGTSIKVGGYVCKIVAAPKYQKWDGSQYVEAKKFEDADRTVIPFDIAEGEFEGYYGKKFKEDDSEGKKWKGTLYLKHPKDTDKYDTNEKRYNSFGAALMDSNSNYSFDINKNESIKGKAIGIVFREHEFRKDNGEIGVYAEPYSTYSVDDIKSGNFRIPKKFAVKDDAPAPVDTNWQNVESTEEELPFA